MQHRQARKGGGPDAHDEKTLALTDQPTLDMVKQQLAGFEKFIRRLNGKK